MPTTPEEWLPILANKLDERAPVTKRLRSYCDGNAPLPEMGKNLKAAWQAFQRKARVNYGGLAVRALKNRIRPRGVLVGDDTEAKDVELACRRIWRDNRLTSQFGLAIRDRLEARVGYLVAGRDSDGRAVVTREKPELFIALTDPLRPWKALVALKVWRDEILGVDFAYVWVTDGRQKFVRKSKDSNGLLHKRAGGDMAGWELAGEPEPYEGDPPVIVLERPDGQALVEPHFDVIDGINLGKLQRLVITAMQAFRQRALKAGKDGGELPEKDEDGNDIDYSKVFEPAPGALWDLPAGIDIWESQSTDIRPLLDGEKADARTFAAVTSTNVSVFVPEGENQSAEGAINAKEGHVSLAEDEIADLAPGLAVALVHALRIEQVELGTATIEIDFAPPALISLTEKYAAAAQAKAAGLPRRTIMRDTLGMSPEAIQQAEADMADEQLAAFTLTGGVPTEQPVVPVAV